MASFERGYQKFFNYATLQRSCLCLSCNTRNEAKHKEIAHYLDTTNNSKLSNMAN